MIQLRDLLRQRVVKVWVPNLNPDEQDVFQHNWMLEFSRGARVTNQDSTRLSAPVYVEGAVFNFLRLTDRTAELVFDNKTQIPLNALFYTIRFNGREYFPQRSEYSPEPTEEDFKEKFELGPDPEWEALVRDYNKLVGGSFDDLTPEAITGDLTASEGEGTDE